MAGNDLRSHKNDRGIVIVIHQPQWYAWSNWSKVHRILREYPVAGVIAGHFHYDQDEGTIDGIRYMVIGATGGSVKDCDRNSGGSHQFAVLTLDGDTFTAVNLYDVETGESLEFTPRASMDRIQSVSTMIANLRSDESLSLVDGGIFSSSGGGKPEPVSEIGLESLMNPIDLPLEIEISSAGELFVNTYWNGATGPLPGDSPFVLAPGERVGWANYSNSGQWRRPPPLWVGEIAAGKLQGGGAQSVDMNIKVSFTDEKPRWIRDTIRFPLRAAGD